MNGKKNKLAIVGVGNVGSAVLNSALSLCLASDIAVIDIQEKKALGEALDANHGAPFSLSPNIHVHAGGYEECKDADVIIIAAGPSIQPGGQTDRLLLADQNVKVIKDVMTSIIQYTKKAVIIMITNPLDITTYYAANFFDYPKNKLFGTGTTLETARLRQIIGSHYQINPQNVHGYMLGEHGNSAFPAWSLISIAGIPSKQLDDYFHLTEPIDRATIAASVVNVAYDVLNFKGCTNYGIAMAACRIARAVFYNEHSIFPVSTTLEGEYGITDVSLSIPCRIGAAGVETRLAVPLCEEEITNLKKSAANIIKVLTTVGLHH